MTDYSGDMGNNFGPKGLSIGSSLQVVIEIAEVIVHKGDEPDVLVDLLHAHLLARQRIEESTGMAK